MTVEQQFRYLYKPAVFAASLVPAALLVCGALGWFGQDLGADPVAKLLHSCGKTGLNFLLLTLLVTPLRRLTGWNNLVRLRRMLGLFAFFYIVAHFSVYLVLDRQLDMHSIVQDIAKRPYITIGFAALLLMVPLAITSTNRMMRRLGRRWQKLHRLIYLIVILGVWHYWWQVKKDIRQPALYVGMVAVLLGIRLAYYLRSRARQARSVTSKSAPATAQERT
ncbi:MAG TPA: protein-methionine-sulfoxide reductase heme-binding subunit MsrQ [Steroidobacteraceae bacterium]|nr:protein-methionine-sulfoxide reductase heme-binding subunit MsrQ [Steroidobacteraceae bacterium]